MTGVTLHHHGRMQRTPTCSFLLPLSLVPHSQVSDADVLTEPRGIATLRALTLAGDEGEANREAMEQCATALLKRIKPLLPEGEQYAKIDVFGPDTREGPHQVNSRPPTRQLCTKSVTLLISLPQLNRQR